MMTEYEGKNPTSPNNPFIPIYQQANNGTNEEKFRRIKEQSGEALPSYLDVELTNHCNFRCRFCPTGTKSMKRAKGFMPPEVADALVDNVKRYRISGVRFIRWGEPTMHPDLIPIMKRVREAGALIHINTNGSLLDEDMIRNLLEIPLDSIKISFQGADEGTYNEMRMGGDYQKLLERVRMIHTLRGEHNSPFIQVSTTITSETPEQLELFKQDVSGICDYYNVGFTKLAHLDVNRMSVSEEEKQKIRELQKSENTHRVYYTVCREAFDKLSVNWNGDVTLCCEDYDNFMVVGNILDMDLKEIFNSRAADQYRKMIIENKHRGIECCRNCYQTVAPIR